MRRLYLALCAIRAAYLLVGAVDRASPPILHEHIRDADQRKELKPEDLIEISYWYRHERNAKSCRGQTYVWQCCDHSRDRGDLTCRPPER